MFIIFFIIVFILSWLLTIRGSTDYNILACGLFGFSGSRPVDETKLRWLAYENQSRGRDSTGVWGNHLYKDKMEARDFILTPGFKAAIKGANTVLGHTRASTSGATNKQNAHPFYYGKGVETDFEVKRSCVGAHNGFVVDVMQQYHEKDLGFTKNFEVDSQLIFAALAKHGNVDVIGKIEGAMGLSFIFPDDDPELLYLYKREETRELHIGEASDGIYYSSTENPLKFVGCRSIWSLLPNMLYSIKRGVIIDVYSLPKPILKSLSSNVTRLGWRAGLPVAEINALPINATGAAEAGAGRRNMGGAGTGTTTSNGEEGRTKQLPLNTAWNGPSRQDLTDSYSNKASSSKVEVKFKMFMANIRQELKNIHVSDDMKINEVVERQYEDMSCCLVSITLSNKENGRPLQAWSVLANEDADIAGLTSMNGLTVFKIPYRYCNTSMKMFAYDPLDQLGPYSFEIVPLAGRVMEVTLEIPFRKEGDETEGDPNTPGPVHYTKDGCWYRKSSASRHNGGAKQISLYERYPRPNCDVVSEKRTPVLGGFTPIQINGCETTGGNPAIILSKHGKDLNSIEEDQNVIEHKDTLIDMKNESDRKERIKLVTDTDELNVYIWYCPGNVIAEIMKTPAYKAWYEFYATNYGDNGLNAFELMQEASRLMAWDKLNAKKWAKMWMYIEILLKHQGMNYISEKYKNLNKFIKIENFWPSTIQQNDVLVEEDFKSKKKVVPMESKVRKILRPFQPESGMDFY